MLRILDCPAPPAARLHAPAVVPLPRSPLAPSRAVPRCAVPRCAVPRPIARRRVGALLLLGGAPYGAACTPSGRRSPEQLPPRVAAASIPDDGAPVDSAALAAALARYAAVPDSLFRSGTFTDAGGVRLVYRLLSPPDPRPGARYPLVVVFHGSGAIGADNAAQLGPFARSWAAPAVRARFPAYVLVPQFPARSAVYTLGAGGVPASSRPTEAADAALALLDSIAARLPVDRGRVYAVGFSMGGSTAWHTAAAAPARFAAALPIAGVAPDAADTARVARLARVPLYVVHGTADAENPIGPDRAMAAALRAAGARGLRVWEPVGLDHRVPPAFFVSDAWRAWLFTQRRAATGTPSAAR